MSYETIINEIEMCWNVSFECRMILLDMKHMLMEFKDKRKLSLITNTHKKELVRLIHCIKYPGRGMRYLWEYSSYFRLKKIYLEKICEESLK